MVESDEDPGLPPLPAFAPPPGGSLRLPQRPSSSSGLSSLPPSSPRGRPGPSRALSSANWRERPAEAEEHYDADEDKSDGEAEGDIPEDIVTKTSQAWHSMRIKGRRQGTAARQYNLRSFIIKYVEDPRRARRLAAVLLEPQVQSTLQRSGATVKKLEEDEEDIASQIRDELKPLQQDPSFAAFKANDEQAPARANEPKSVEELCNTDWLDCNLRRAWPTLKEKAPVTVKLFSQVMQSQWEKSPSVEFDDSLANNIYLLTSLLFGGIARNKASFLKDILGLYLMASGTARRAIETLNHLGVVPSHWTLNRMLNHMASDAKHSIKNVAHDPNAIVVYDNFNFKNRVRELAGGKQDHFVNLTTALLVACPELNGPFKQVDMDLTVAFTRKMVIEYLLPRRPAINTASRWLIQQSFFKLFREKDKDIPPMPTVKQVTFKQSPYLQLGAIFEDEGTIDGVYRLHETLFKERLNFKEFTDRLLFVYGDQKTTSFIRRIKNSQLESVDVWEQKKWMVPVSAFFHIELNYIEMLFRMFWDTGTRTTSSATISADVHFFHRGRNIGKKDIKYHQVLPLLMHGYTARILAFIIAELMDEGALQGPLSVGGIQNAIAAIDSEDFNDPFLLDRVFERVWEKVFSPQAWSGRYDDSPDVDVEFRSHCRLMQATEILLLIHEAVRAGDYGFLQEIIPALPVLFWGGKGSNYGPEMLYFAWLLHPSVSKKPGLAEAILKGGLIHCITAGSGYKAIDLLLEHVNASYALDIKYNKNSTHDIQATFSRLALNGNYLATIRKSVEKLFKSKQKGTHTAGDARTDIISYACKLYNDGITARQTMAVNMPAAPYDAPDIYEHGQKVLLSKLADFNAVVPEPKDAADQRLLPGLGFGGTEDGEVDWMEEGERLFDVTEEDFWRAGVDSQQDGDV